MRWVISLVIFVVCAVASHFVILTNIPGFIMGKAHTTFESQGIPENTWLPSPRQTPETQRIVRPSPDLAYAICRFDTRKGPIAISAPTGDSYGSLSIFNDQTDNVFVGDLSNGSALTRIVVREAANDDDPQSLIVRGKGIAVIRRLAPTQAEFDRAAALVADATCQPFEG